MADKLSREELARLKEAGINYPYRSRQVLALLEANDQQAREIKRLQRVILETSRVFTGEEMDRVLKDD